MTPERHRGFSLLELMVVVTIIGIFIGVAVLSVGVTGNDRESEQEVFRMKSIIDLLREESLLQGVDYGVLFSRAGFQFYQYDYVLQEWIVPADDELMRPRTLAETLDLAVSVDDRPIVLDDAPDTEDGEEADPQVMILSTGEMTPFELAIFRDPLGVRHVLTAAFDGEMELEVRE